MKRILIALLVITSIAVSAQESVLLRLNYTKGDSYLMTVESKQGMGAQGGVNMKMNMGVIVSEVSGDNVKTESKILSVAVDMMQGGMAMSYDSNKKDEELDQMGQMLKSQFDPMMNSIIYNSYDKLGNITETKVEPSVPGMNQLTEGSGSVIYPNEKISVGSSWSSNKDNQLMKTTTTYTVSQIKDGIVYLDITGNVSGAEGVDGAVKGSSEIEVSTGLAKKTSIEVAISNQGMDITINSNITMTKN
ncbi:DUF6263 family protein [Flavobacteriaceae bacterium]|nr:DUF6263 family protein [Flavobacteriaceae bacterium]